MKLLVNTIVTTRFTWTEVLTVNFYVTIKITKFDDDIFDINVSIMGHTSEQKTASLGGLLGGRHLCRTRKTKIAVNEIVVQFVSKIKVIL